VGLVGCDDGHPADRRGERRAIGDHRLVIVLGNDLLVVGIRPLDQAGEHRHAVAPEAEVVLRAGDLDRLLGIE
jgi:hypothetical protein